MSRLRKRRPAAGIALGLFLIVAGALVASAGFGGYPPADETSYVQNHGRTMRAAVGNVDVRKYCGKGCLYDALVTVTLRQAVSGRRTSVIHIPRNVSYDKGEVISVIIDPRHPGYGELPGIPDVPSPARSGIVAATAVLVLWGLVHVATGIRALRRRMARRAAGTGTRADAR